VTFIEGTLSADAAHSSCRLHLWSRSAPDSQSMVKVHHVAYFVEYRSLDHLIGIIIHITEGIGLTGSICAIDYCMALFIIRSSSSQLMGIVTPMTNEEIPMSSSIDPSLSKITTELS
jgi:hypothetical protein